MCIDKPVPHKHAALIKAWADGALIQARQTDGGWGDCRNNSPCWSLHSEYRIKPKPKVKKYRWLLKDSRNKYALSVSHHFYKDLAEANCDNMHGWYVPVEQLASTMEEFEE